MIKKYKLLFLSSYLMVKESIKYLYHRNKDKAFINFVETLANSNIFYVKLFQSLGTNTRLFTNIQREYLLKYLDKVPYHKNDVNSSMVDDIIKIGKDNSNLLIDPLSLEQINSGIIAIVYKTKMNKKDIIIKIKKNNIDKTVCSALDEVELILYLLNLIPSLKYYYLMDMFLESKTLLIKQLDFNQEIINQNNFYDNNKHTDYVVIPQVYDIFTETNDNIIVMEYLDGKPFDMIKEKNKKEYSKLIAKFSLKSILFNRLLHSDLHGGNIIFMENDNIKQLGIIDFGIVGYTTKEVQNIYYNFMKSLFVEKDCKKTANLIVDSITVPVVVSPPRPPLNNELNCGIYKEQKHIAELEELLKNLINLENELDMYNSYNINKILSKIDLKLAPFLYILLYSIASCYSLCTNLSDDENFLKNINNICKDLL